MTSSLNHCSCIQEVKDVIFTDQDIKFEDTSCSMKSFMRGAHQKVKQTCIEVNRTYTSWKPEENCVKILNVPF